VGGKEPANELSILEYCKCRHIIALYFSVHIFSHLKPKIRERTISLRFLGIILGVLRLEVSVYYVYIAKQFQTTFVGGEGEGGGG